jgi:adenosylcobyric acid synthase
MNSTRAIFVGGTASHVGKSWFATAFCRLLRNRGVRVAPFKAQNMSNNSFPCIEGGEIGRAQAVQAEACRVPAMADMNPVLLKPNSVTGSQVVVQGKVWTSVEAAVYGSHTEFLFAKALASFQRLSGQFEAIVCEGAGSVAEVNLYDRDFTNLRMAEAARAKTLLVADIERGGVFASLVGTFDLLPPERRSLVRAFAVNRFRGDRSLFDEGVRFLESRLGVPCLGVFPLDRSILIDDEDSLSLDECVRPPAGHPVAILRFPRISNFTDFAALGEVDWIDTPPPSSPYKVVILPGSKNTIEDLAWMRAKKLDAWVIEQARLGVRVLGICGGFQMLGESISDPSGVEGAAGTTAAGLCLLPVRTILTNPKITRRVAAVTPKGVRFQAYEIHMGRTSGSGASFATLEDGQADGCVQGNVAGTYLHGSLDSPEAVAEYLGVTAIQPQREEHYDALAQWLTAYSRPEVLEDLLT